MNAVFFNVACGGNKPFSYTIKIGDTPVKTGSCTGTFAEYSIILDTALEGKVTVEITNIVAYIDVKGFAINAIA